MGTVRGPAGPAGGATVRIDRIVADREVRTDVTADPEGRWELRDVPGGRYRVRAFLAPTLAQTTAEVRFLRDRDEHTFELVMEEQQGLVLRADSAPDPPTVGNPVNLVLLVAQRTVDPDGIVRAAPLAGAVVELGGLGRWVLRDDGGFGSDSATVRLTDGGRARFELRCEVAGPPGLSLRVPVTVAPAPTTTAQGAPPAERQVTVETIAIEVPPCEAPARATTTTGDEDPPSGSTTSTRPPTSTSSTSP